VAKAAGHRWSWTLVPWFAAAAFGLAAVFFFQQSDRLAQRVAELQTESSQQQGQLERAREVVSTLTSTDALRVTLVAAQSPPQPQGKAIYVRDRSSLVFLASNMPALPPQKAYELWLIPTNGGAPIPAGVFKPDAHGSATVIQPPLPAGIEAKAFAITVEPEQGSTAPTMPIVMMGAGE
jgi:anti-sigma-K factor RskA